MCRELHFRAVEQLLNTWSEYCKMQHSLEMYIPVSEIIGKSVGLGRGLNMSAVLTSYARMFFSASVTSRKENTSQYIHAPKKSPRL